MSKLNIDISKIRFGVDGLIPAIVQDYRSGEVLMLAYMNKQALQKTLDEQESCFWSRSRQELWHKGATSGNVQKVKEIYYDCDEDSLLLKVEQSGAGACHTGRMSCFYRKLQDDADTGQNS